MNDPDYFVYILMGLAVVAGIAIGGLGLKVLSDPKVVAGFEYVDDDS
jgi:hypothetical protein